MNGSRRLVVLLAVVAVGVSLAGCGGDAGSDSGSGDAVAAVEAEVTARGTTQNVSCESTGTEEVSGAETEVVRCSYEEESSQDGDMRPADRCFVVAADGAVTDVTVELRARGSCPVN